MAAEGEGGGLKSPSSSSPEAPCNGVDGRIPEGANNVFNRKPRVVYGASGSFNGNSLSPPVDPDLPTDGFFWLPNTQSF